MEARKIYVRPAVLPDSERIPVNRSLTIRTPTNYEICRDETSIVPDTWEEATSQRALTVWAERLAPSIARMLPSNDYTFTPLAVQVEKDEFYRNGVRDYDVISSTIAPPRRVRVVRRRVTLFGTVNSNHR